MNNKSKLSRLTRISLCAAFMCVIAPLALPLSAIPLTFGTFCLYLIALSFCPFDAFLTVLVYVAVGALGLPVFSGFTGGAQMLIGPTGGFLLAYPLTALLISLLANRKKTGNVRRLFALFCGTALLYACGLIGYLLVTDSPFDLSLFALFAPLFLSDFVKMTASLFVFLRLRPFLEKKC